MKKSFEFNTAINHKDFSHCRRHRWRDGWKIIAYHYNKESPSGVYSAAYTFIDNEQELADLRRQVAVYGEHY